MAAKAQKSGGKGRPYTNLGDVVIDTVVYVAPNTVITGHEAGKTTTITLNRNGVNEAANFQKDWLLLQPDVTPGGGANQYNLLAPYTVMETNYTYRRSKYGPRKRHQLRLSVQS